MNKPVKQYYDTFIPAFSNQQMRLINNLVGQALLSHSLAHRLVILRDEQLASEFNLSPEIWGHLNAIKAHSLEEFCLQLTQLQYRLSEDSMYRQSNFA